MTSTKRATTIVAVLAVGLALSLVAFSDSGDSTSDAATRRLRSAIDLPDPQPCDGCWVPPVVADWQIQFNGTIDTSEDIDMFEVDMFDTSRAMIDEFHANGTPVVCYISAGSWENWRPDADKYPKRVLGRALPGWPGERWVDIRRLRTLKPLLQARIDRCRSKGFDSVEFDNVNGYQNPTGFPLKGADQLRFNAWLANASHKTGLSVGLKNEGPQADRLVDYFDWALVESCFRYHECGDFDVFVDRGKAVMEIEYELERSEFCDEALDRGFNAMKKRRSLNGYREPCERQSPGTPSPTPSSS